MDWQPIETAPKNLAAIMLYVPDRANSKYCFGYWSDGWYDEDGYPVNASHWQPLPQPPEQ